MSESEKKGVFDKIPAAMQDVCLKHAEDTLKILWKDMKELNDSQKAELLDNMANMYKIWQNDHYPSIH